jgi:hypothetical protein
MKNKFIFLILLLHPFASFCQRSYKADLNQLGTITFPDTPKYKQVKASDFYSLSSNRGVDIAEVTPINKRFKDFFTSHLTDSVYKRVVDGSLKIAKGKLLYKKNIRVNGVDGIAFGYTSKFNGVNYYRYHQSFFFNKTLILFGYWSRDSLQTDDKDLKAFFGSFKLSIKASDISQDNAPTFVPYLAYGIGFVLFFVIVGLLVFAVVFVAKKMSRS